MESAALHSAGERKLGANDFIVSKTDINGCITYANRTFMEISGYPESELLGIQHNIIRHPDMPRGVFRLMWNTLKLNKEFFGFVKNQCADGSYYWVFANITQDYDKNGKLYGYYSVRRRPPQSAIELISSIYKQMINIEKTQSKPKAPDKSMEFLLDFVRTQGVADYATMVLSMYRPFGV